MMDVDSITENDDYSEYETRVTDALNKENCGNQHQKRMEVTERAFDAMVRGALGEEIDRCE